MAWRVVEVLGYAYYVSKGYRILHPLVEAHGYDFVAEKNGEFVRVNVKQAYKRQMGSTPSWCISMAGKSNVPTHPAVDVFLAYIPTVGRFIELPGDFFEGVSGRSRRIPVAATKHLEEENG